MRVQTNAYHQQTQYPELGGSSCFRILPSQCCLYNRGPVIRGMMYNIYIKKAMHIDVVFGIKTMADVLLSFLLILHFWVQLDSDSRKVVVQYVHHDCSYEHRVTGDNTYVGGETVRLSRNASMCSTGVGRGNWFGWSRSQVKKKAANHLL